MMEKKMMEGWSDEWEQGGTLEEDDGDSERRMETRRNMINDNAGEVRGDFFTT